MGKSGKLNDRQEAFIREYLISRNASDAYRKAGYASKNPDVDAAKLLVNPSIKVRIEERLAELNKIAEEKYQVTQEAIIDELAAIGFGNLANVCDWDNETLYIKPSKDLDPRHQKYVESVKRTTQRFGTGPDALEVTTTEIKTLANQKKPALELLGKHLGMWSKLNGPGTGSDSKDTAAILSRVSAILRKRNGQ